MSICVAKEGLVFDDNFPTLNTTRWECTPANCVLDTAARLRMMHSTTYAEVTVLTALPVGEPELLFEVHSTYSPTTPGDSGGILVWEGAADKLSFLESLDTYQSTDYTRWRAHKKGTLWDFYAYRNGIWDLFDTAALNATKVGLLLTGIASAGFIDMQVERAVLTRGSAVELYNLDYTLHKVELYEGTDTLVASIEVPTNSAAVSVELPYMPFTGAIKIKNKDTDALIDSLTRTFYGGDVLYNGAALSVTWEGVELSKTVPTYLGRMNNATIERRLLITNNATGTAGDVSVVVKQYLYDNGFEFVDVAPDVTGTAGTYADVVELGNIAAGASVYFWVRVTRDQTIEHDPLMPAEFLIDVVYTT